MVGGEKTSLGGEYVGGEIVPWWRVRMVASLLGGEVTGNHKDILFDGLACKTREYFTNCGVLFRSPKGREMTRAITEIPICPLVVYVKTSNKGFTLPLLFHFK